MIPSFSFSLYVINLPLVTIRPKLTTMHCGYDDNFHNYYKLNI